MEITINYYGQAVSVSVEVYEYLTQADHKAENLAHEQRRHWDGREFDEYIIAAEGRLPYCATPEELICQRETLDEILAVLALCTTTQRERFLLYALEHSPSPEQLVMLTEERAERDRLATALREAFAYATPTQARRVCAYYLSGLTQQEIADRESVHNSNVCLSIRRGLCNLRRYYADHPQGK